MLSVNYLAAPVQRFLFGLHTIKKSFKKKKDSYQVPGFITYNLYFVRKLKFISNLKNTLHSNEKSLFPTYKWQSFFYSL